ncbi:MAG: hypothetical protein ACI304_09025 [Lepagella sp.]
MELLTIIVPIITLILGGGIGWIFTIKYTRRQAEADAMQHYQTAYQGLITDLQEDRKALREEILELKDRINKLEEGQEKNANVIKQLARMACVKASKCLDCVLIDISQL